MTRLTKILAVVALVAATFVATAGRADAHGTVDQEYVTSSGPLCYSERGASFAQTFTPTATSLTSVDIFPAFTSRDFTVTIRDGGPDGAVLAAATATTTDGGFNVPTHVDLPAPVATTPGNTYTIRFQALDATMPYYFCGDVSSDGYPGGSASVCNPTCRNSLILDFYFRTYTEPPAVCSRAWATISVDDSGIIRGGPDDGTTYKGKFTGTAGDDRIVGTSTKDRIDASDGDDIVCALGGDDIVWAGNGDDTVYGGAGNDTIFGQGGDDNLNGNDDDDHIQGNSGNDTLRGGSGADHLDGGGGNDKTPDYKPGEGDTLA